MFKRYYIISLLFVAPFILSACGQKTEEPVVEPSANEINEPANEQAPSEETALMAALAKRQNQDENKYQLHNLSLSGDYAQSQFSYDNQLAPTKFWAKKEAGAWQIVSLDEEAPLCSLLDGFPVALKAGCYSNLNNGQISNFNDCLKAGFTATNDKPRRCLDASGNVFVEIAGLAPVKRYISQDVGKCGDLDFSCLSHEKLFLDEHGCGCQVTSQAIVAPEQHKCLAEQRQAEMCIMEYNPVCGWSDDSIKCFKYPCARVYGNACEACRESTVAYWTAGECPK